MGSPIAKLGGERSEGVVRSQAVFHATGERRVGRRLPLRTHMNQIDSELDATGIDAPLRGVNRRAGLAGLVPRDGRRRHPHPLREFGPGEAGPLPRLPDQRAQGQGRMLRRPSQPIA